MKIKKGMLNWSRQFSILLFLDSNKNVSQYGKYECILAAGVSEQISGDDTLSKLSEDHTRNKDWIFGHISYEYKDVLEPKLSSTHHNTDGFPLIFFYRPEIVCHINTNCTELHIECIADEPDTIYKEIVAAVNDDKQQHSTILSFIQRTSKVVYLKTVDHLRQHIKQGDCYEINYCTEGYAENVTMEPFQSFNSLNKISPAPFAAYYRNKDSYMMCASPERFLKKLGADIIAQPIKGTIRRGRDNEEDESLKEQLYNSIKDRAENVMITDLMRNDLARSCVQGSIKVSELYGIYTFPQVHQMISTVQGQLSHDKTLADVLKFSFPMGSMTGAPKMKVMELIEEYEDMARGLFSGTVGYISPEGDFDFNVIIRSLFYNADTKYLSYKSGGAITYDSNAEDEWEEMRLKAMAMERIFR